MDWKAILSTVAPVLASAAGGPLAGVAVQAIGKALELPEATQESVEQAVLGASPETLLALKQADQQFVKDMKALDIDVLKVEAGDRDSARQRQIATKDRAPDVLAAVVVITWGIIQYQLLTTIIDPSMRELVARVLGTLDAALMAVLYYYFGSSASSARKDELMGRAIK